MQRSSTRNGGGAFQSGRPPQLPCLTSIRPVLGDGWVRQAMWERPKRNTFRTSYSMVEALQAGGDR